MPQAKLVPDKSHRPAPNQPQRRPVRRVYLCPICGSELIVLRGEIYCTECPTDYAPSVPSK